MIYLKRIKKPVLLAEKLLADGYKVAPVDSEGALSLPGEIDKNSSYSHIDAHDWKRNYPLANLGLICGYNNVVALDFDICDETILLKLRRKIMCKYYQVPTKLFKDNRFTVFFAADDTLTDIGSVRSNVYKYNGGTLNKIELITNKIVTIYSDYTNDTFKWLSNDLMYVNVASLPIISYGFVTAIFNVFHNLSKKHSKVLNRRILKNVDIASINSPSYLNRTYTDEEVDGILKKSDAKSDGDWLDVGLALHSNYKGSAIGFKKWLDWAKKGGSNRDNDNHNYHWNEFNSDDMKLGVIEKRISIKEQNKNKIRSPEDELEYMNVNFVFIQKGNLIGDLGEKPNESMSRLLEIQKWKCNIQIPIERIDGRDGQLKDKKAPVFNVWLKNPHRINAWDVGFAPGAGRLIASGFWKDKDRIYYNRYVPPAVKLTDNDNLLHHFMSHMRYLFPNGGHEWMLNWMAQIVQEPSKRYRTAPLSISLYEGTGRRWMADLLNALVGGDNVSTLTDINDMVRPGTKTGYLKDTILLVINEVYVHGRPRLNLVQKLKTLLSDDLQEIDVKYGSHKYNEQVYMRVFFQSNYIDGLVLHKNDTRIQPFINRSPPKPPEYYNLLYDLLKREDGEFINQIYSYLLNYKVDKNRLTSSEDTEDRRDVIMSTKSPTALAFYEFKKLVGDGVFTDDMLNDFMIKFSSLSAGGYNKTSQTDRKELFALKEDKVLYSNNININNELINVKAFDFLKEVSNDALKNSLNKTQERIIDNYKLIHQHKRMIKKEQEEK